MLKTFHYLLIVGIICATQITTQVTLGQQIQDLNAQNAAQLLAGQTSQTWVFQRIETVMGASGGCHSGETWTFSADHTVKIETCENQRLVTKTLAWSLSQAGALDTIVTVGGTLFYLRIWKSPSETMMKLQTMSDSKTEARIDREFRLQKAE